MKQDDALVALHITQKALLQPHEKDANGAPLGGFEEKAKMSTYPFKGRFKRLVGYAIILPSLVRITRRSPGHVQVAFSVGSLSSAFDIAAPY